MRKKEEKGLFNAVEKEYFKVVHENLVIYSVELTLIEPVLGTLPKIPDVYDNYIRVRAKGKETKDEFESPLPDEEITRKEAQGWTGFMMENGNPFVMDYYIRGYLKNYANIFKDILNIKNARSKLENFVFVLPRKIFFNQGITDEPLSRPLRVQTAQGPRVSLAKSDQIAAGSTLKFELHLPWGGPFTEKHLRFIFDAGRYQGIGQFRGGGYGKFIYTMEKVKPKDMKKVVNIVECLK